MIIVSQDKNRIFNAKNLVSISIEFIHGNYELRASFLFELSSINIGNYDTEERAKEVLQELVQALYLKPKVNITSNSIDLNTEEIYYMPKE